MENNILEKRSRNFLKKVFMKEKLLKIISFNIAILIYKDSIIKFITTIFLEKLLNNCQRLIYKISEFFNCRILVFMIY